ncbi:hypothetical protein [Streptomyces gilvus]|uniref:hypothetical protein n=1 Tax=Streptomyces gilvus TaxID=2920937 RepID=UPI001F1039D2|nr:hypothetical protein [Streptomyces sp. CME 23]MCH5677860.1 hypothetical protein [Streptomyces sp. CME 23]
MSAPKGVGGQIGKSTFGSGQLPVGEATRTLSLPQLPYGDAVHAELTAHGLMPGATEAGVRGKSELFLRLSWPPGHQALGEDVDEHGLNLVWSHVTGWSAHDRHGEYLLLDVDVLAAPKVIHEAALEFTQRHLDATWQATDRTARWEHALYLDIALVNFDEREQTL